MRLAVSWDRNQVTKEIISLDGINKTYLMGSQEIEALKDINLVVSEGEFLVVMGPSGSGKSTLMNVIGLLDQPDSGIYSLNGLRVDSLTDSDRSKVRNETIGFIFQNFNLLHRATALRNVMLPLAYRAMIESERINIATNALDSVGLQERIHHLSTQLSGGERQRVAIARALVGKPTVILADEPTGNLDTKTGVEIIDLLVQMSNQGQTVIMVTHDSRLIKYADRVINFLDGIIVEDKHIRHQ